MPDGPGNTRERTRRIAAWFLGPKAENASIEEELMLYILRDYYHWRRNYYPSDEIAITQHLRRESLDASTELLQQSSEMLAGLKRHYPFYSPRYIAHMLSDQTIASRLGYFAAMLYNPNNVSPEAAPVTVEWELEVAASILRMLGYRPPPPPGAHHRETRKEFGWAHITGGGTVANLESLWAARNVLYFPLAVRAAAEKAGIEVAVKLPGDEAHASRSIVSLSPQDLLALKPNESVFLLPRWIEAVKRHYPADDDEATRAAWEMLGDTGLHIPSAGTAACYAAHPPAILACGTAHYSIEKIADLLGIGRGQVIHVEADSHFRMDAPRLEEALIRTRRDGLYPVAVVAIGGSTEEGAVDPIHRVDALRSRLERESNQSFWLHIDAAWGGYFRTLFVTGGEDGDGDGTVADFVSRPLHLERNHYKRSLEMRWGNREVLEAFRAFPRAESITVDPHKMGYVPYPCGVVAFRNDRVRHFLSQDIAYLTDWTRDETRFRPYEPPSNTGAFILEGSKPGAAATACWMSHRMVAPTREGYGEIMRASLLAARELHERLVHWEASCQANHESAAYSFLPVTSGPPDTNVVCFVVQQKGNSSLARMNQIGRAVYEEFTLPSSSDKKAYSYGQPFFLSRTRFQPPHYSDRAVAGLLERAGVEPGPYGSEGVFVLRATVMNPYIVLMAETGHKQAFLAEFLEALAERTRRILSGPLAPHTP